MPRVVLGIETSCDETAAAILVEGRAVSDRITTQILHEQYGGVVPELASRAHERLLAPAVKGALNDAGLNMEDVEAVAVTFGPGLVGALLVGLAFAKGLSLAGGVPFWAVNHLEGHLWSPGLTCKDIPLPFLALIVSGGHTLLVDVQDFGVYGKVGSTRDDAVGELFDKVGRMVGFSFPAGEAIDKAAMECDDDPVPLPRARLESEPTAFSFSGLKTAALYYLKRNHAIKPNGSFTLSAAERAAFCAGLMNAASESIAASIKTALSVRKYKALCVVGGVSASRSLRKSWVALSDYANVPLFIPPLQHCTDNGAMIAYAGYQRMIRNVPPSEFSCPVEPSASLFTISPL